MAADRLSDDSDTEDLFASPSKKSGGGGGGKEADRPKTPKTPKTPTNPPGASSSRYDDREDAREAILRRELEGVRNINELIEGVVGTLERAKGNMHVSSGDLLLISFPPPSKPYLSQVPHLTPPNTRRSRTRSTQPRRCSTPGRASSRRRSTTSA